MQELKLEQAMQRPDMRGGACNPPHYGYQEVMSHLGPSGLRWFYVLQVHPMALMVLLYHEST